MLHRRTLRVAGALLVAGLAAAAPAADPAPAFTLLAIGDTGEANIHLYRNARGIHDEAKRLKQPGAALLFLGDNFYKHGLADETGKRRDERFRDIYGRWFAPSFNDLGMEKRGERAARPSASEREAGNVHAIAGNHDYYSRRASTLYNLSILPLGFTSAGNLYESLREEWVYHYRDVDQIRWQFGRSTDPGDKTGVQAIFLDSNLLVRNDWDVPDAQCGAPAARPPGEDPPDGDLLKCGERLRIRGALVEALDKYAQENVWRVLVTHHPLDTVGLHGGASWVPTTKEGGRIESENLCSPTARPFDEFKNRFDPEDLCTRQTAKYVRFVLKAVADSNGGKGTPVHVVLSGHDHSLQLIDLRRKESPLPDELSSLREDLRQSRIGVQIVSGAGAKTSEVGATAPTEGLFTTNRKGEDLGRRGVSLPGWARIRFEARKAIVTFHSGRRDVTEQMAGAPAIELLPDADDRLTVRAPKK